MSTYNTALQSDQRFYELQRGNDYLDQLTLHLRYENWNKKPGQQVAYEYYAGVEAGNPSGTTTNVKYIRYIDTVTGLTIMTRELKYNTADCILSDTSLMTNP